MKLILTNAFAFLLFFVAVAQDSQNSCTKHTLHTINHSFLFNQIGEDHPITYNPARYKQGYKGIKKYFDKNPIEAAYFGDELIVNLYISFEVSCAGKAQNFTLINELNLNCTALAEAVVHRLESMPNKWTPATSRSTNVDSYQVIEFTFVQGNLQRLYVN